MLTIFCTELKLDGFSHTQWRRRFFIFLAWRSARATAAGQQSFQSSPKWTQRSGRNAWWKNSERFKSRRMNRIEKCFRCALNCDISDKTVCNWFLLTHCRLSWLTTICSSGTFVSTVSASIPSHLWRRTCSSCKFPRFSYIWYSPTTSPLRLRSCESSSHVLKRVSSWRVVRYVWSC